MPEQQIHRHALAPVQVRFAVDQAAGTFTGYAAVFNDLVPTYNERVLPGAFKRTLAERAARGDKLAILWAHDPREIIGVAVSLVEDDYGLRVEGRLILDIARAADAYKLIQEGIQSLSIGFWPVKWTRNDQGEYLIEDAELFEFSVVYAGASPRAKITEIRQAGGNPMPEAITPETPATPEQRAAAAAALASNQAVTALEARMAEMQATITELEAREQRPGETPSRNGNAEDVERRALTSFIRTGLDTEIRAAATDNDPSGGYFVLPTIDTQIRTIMRDISPLRGLADVVTISGDSYERFYNKGARGAQWVGEHDARPQDTARPELIKHSYPVMELYAAPATTRHLLEDAAIDIASWLINDATADFAETEGADFLTSDGAGGKPKGLLSYGVTNEKDKVRAWGKHQYIPAGHATAPTDANWVKACTDALVALKKRFRTNATWLMNSATYGRLLGIKDDNGRRLWAPTGNLIEGINAPLLGRPVEIDENMPDIGENTLPIALGDFKEGYVIVDRQGVRIERDAITQKGKIVFDTYKRVGGGVGDFNAIKFIKVAAA